MQRLLASHLETVTAAAANAAPALERAAEIFKREVRALLGDDAPDDEPFVVPPGRRLPSKHGNAGLERCSTRPMSWTC